MDTSDFFLRGVTANHGLMASEAAAAAAAASRRPCGRLCVRPRPAAEASSAGADLGAGGWPRGAFYMDRTRLESKMAENKNDANGVVGRCGRPPPGRTTRPSGGKKCN